MIKVGQIRLTESLDEAIEFDRCLAIYFSCPLVGIAKNRQTFIFFTDFEHA